jgi:6-phosphofructokinase 1
LIEVSAHDIGYFFYNGGNDSADTSHKVTQIAQALGYPLVCVGIPKTVDNDLALTDCCPGFGSVAKYVAISIREAGYDVASMARTSTRVFILEVMGRHAGWITAACGLAQDREGESPHILLFPEIPFDEERFLARVSETIARFGYCTVAVSEGLRRLDGKFLRNRACATRSATRSWVVSRRCSRSSSRTGSSRSTTGRWPITCSAPRAISRRRPTHCNPTRWARPRLSSP